MRPVHRVEMEALEASRLEPPAELLVSEDRLAGWSVEEVAAGRPQGRRAVVDVGAVELRAPPLRAPNMGARATVGLGVRAASEFREQVVPLNHKMESPR